MTASPPVSHGGHCRGSLSIRHCVVSLFMHLLELVFTEYLYSGTSSCHAWYELHGMTERSASDNSCACAERLRRTCNFPRPAARLHFRVHLVDSPNWQQGGQNISALPPLSARRSKLLTCGCDGSKESHWMGVSIGRDRSRSFLYSKQSASLRGHRACPPASYMMPSMRRAVAWYSETITMACFFC